MNLFSSLLPIFSLYDDYRVRKTQSEFKHTLSIHLSRSRGVQINTMAVGINFKVKMRTHACTHRVAAALRTAGKLSIQPCSQN